jgi:hypothetical integral membrane protein (TIGR02206 family)
MTVRNLWAKDYSGRPFELFGRPHLAALAVVAAVNIGWAVVGPGLTPEARLLVRGGMALWLLANEAVFHLWTLSTRQWTVQTMLPLHVCAILIYLTAYMLLSGNYYAYEFCYFLGVGGAVQALLTPDAGRYGFPHVRFFTTLIAHSLLFSAPLYMTLVEGYRPVPLSIVRVVVELMALAVVVGLINWRLGSNYMYLMRPPDTPSLIDKLGPWPWYLLSLFGLALIVLVVLYLPFAFSF